MRVLLTLLVALGGTVVHDCSGFFLPSTPQQQRIKETSLAAVNGLAASNANIRMPMRPGSSVALVTPMKDDGSLDLPALEALLNWHVELGTQNLCILGTTGEANTLNMDERRQVLEMAVQTVKNKIPILAGTGTIDPRHVKEQTLQAIDIGCDAALIVTPYYVKPPQRALIKHFWDAADIGLPVVVYNVPGRAGVNLQDENMAILAQHDNIVGLKDATGDLSRVTNLRYELSKDKGEILLYSGDDGTSKDFVILGGDGCISVTANVAPNQMYRMMDAAHRGDALEAAALNEEIRVLHNELFVEANPIPVKWAMYKLGRIPSPMCRPPLDALDSKWHDEVESMLKQTGVLEKNHA